MYKELIDKGFKPIYYTNSDWEETRKTDSRLFYRYDLKTKEIINIVLNILNIFDEYFWIMQCEDLICYIETDENITYTFLYFYNVDAEAYEMTIENTDEVVKVLPNNFIFEHAE